MTDPNVIVTPEQARLGAEDAGIRDRHRVRACAKTTWCYLADDHGEGCAEEPRKPIERNSFGPGHKPRWSP